jgi:aryl-alcohol dehydrogenase-like predicted oxidoreductase
MTSKPVACPGCACKGNARQCAAPTVSRNRLASRAGGTLGLGVMPWSPLGGGILSGKYAASDVAAGVAAPRNGGLAATGQLNATSLRIVEEVKAVARETGHSAAQVALAWTLLNPAVTAPVIGARTLAQVEGNLGALGVALDAGHVARLDAASRPAPIFPQRFVETPLVRQPVFGGAAVARRGA